MKKNNHLPFPFPNKATLVINNKTKITNVKAELATSPIEIYQSACFRNPDDLKDPLVLVFGDPTLQYFSLQNFQFKVEQILVEHKANQIAGVHWHYPNQSTGTLIQGYSELAFLILAKPGFCQEHNMNLKDTTITLKHEI
jgi:hypothetical protein